MKKKIDVYVKWHSYQPWVKEKTYTNLTSARKYAKKWRKIGRKIKMVSNDKIVR